SGVQRRVSELLEASLTKAGYDVTLKEVQLPQVYGYVNALDKAPDLLLSTNTPDGAHPDLWARILFSSKGGLNFLGFSDKRIDALLDQAYGAEKAQADEQYRAVGQRFVDGDGLFFLGAVKDVFVLRKDLASFAPATIELALSAAALAAVMGLGLGLLLAGGGRAARVVRVALMGAASLPIFLVGLLGIVVFYSALGWLPASGRIDDTLAYPDGPTGLFVPDALLHADPVMLLSALAHLAMPAFALALLPALAIARTLHASLAQVMREDYVRTARSKGLSER